MWSLLIVVTGFGPWVEDPMWSLLIVVTGFGPWVELPVQRRLYPIFVSGVGLPDIHEYSAS